MEDAIVLYASAEHLNSMLLLGKLISKHRPSISVVILSTAEDSAAASVAGVPSISYRRLKAAILPPDLTRNPLELLFVIPRLQNPSLREALEELSKKSKIRALVIDFFCNSAFEVSTSCLNIPTYFYVSSGAFGLCAFLYFPTIDETVPKDIGELNDFLEIPGCPPVHSSDFPKAMFFRKSNIYKHFLNTAKNMRRSTGIVVNAFDALEFRAKEALVNNLCIPNSPTPPVFLVGPLVAETSSKTNGEHECLKWLDLQPSKSVIFLCFGRRGLFSAQQLREMAIGLENSGHRFLWSVRNPPGELNRPMAEDPDLDALLPEGFLERTKDRGFVIKTWAPQKEVLSHDAVGGFVTHCGRSSILEAAACGVPMIGWPMDAEQRMNRVFMVEEMQVALPLEEAEEGYVTAAELEKRVRELMESSKGKTIRRRVAEMKIAAEAAVRKGGSSVVALEQFIDTVIS